MTELNFWCHCFSACFSPYKDFTNLQTFFLSFVCELFWLIHIDLLFEVAIKKNSLDIHLVNKHFVD